MPDLTDLDADRYLKEVAPYLAAVSAQERADLLDDLAQHLREIAAEPGPPLAERLGPPEAYAAELLASAGVTAGGPRPALLARAASLVTGARHSSIGRELVRLLPVLHPAWWILRAYLIVSLLGALESHGSYSRFPFPRLAGNAALGVIAVIVAIPVSVRLGQRHLPRAGRLAMIGANIILAIYALVLLGRTSSPEVRYIQNGNTQPADTQNCLMDSSGQNITNRYAYGPDGSLLDPVLLYGEHGRPIDNLCPNYDDQGRRLTTQYGRDVNGAPVINAFPRRQSVMNEGDPAVTGPGSPVESAPTSLVQPPAVVVPRLAQTTTSTIATTTTAPAHS
jgi:hypothetical protein